MPDIVTPLASVSIGSGVATSANVQSCDLNPRVVRVGVWARLWVSTDPLYLSLADTVVLLGLVSTPFS